MQLSTTHDIFSRLSAVSRFVSDYPDSWPTAREMQAAESEGESSDVELLRAVANRSPAAFSKFYDRFSSAVYNIAYSILRNENDAEDVLQEVFLKIWNGAKNYDSNLGKPKSWVSTLARNKSIDILRASGRRGRIAREILFEPGVGEGAVANSVDLAISMETAFTVRTSLNHLPYEQRQAIELAFFKGLTQSEVARNLHQPLGTIKARIRRGMIQLRTLLREKEDDS